MKILIKNSSVVFCRKSVSPICEVLFSEDGYGNISNEKKFAIDTMVNSLINGGLWDKILRLYVPCFAQDASKGWIEIKSTVDSNEVVISTMQGSKYEIQPNVGCVVEANASLDAKLFRDSMEDGYSLFGYASTGYLGCFYKDNSQRGYIASDIRCSTTADGSAVTLISDKTTDGLGLFTLGDEGYFAVDGTGTKTRNDAVFASGNYDFYASFGTSSPSVASTIKWFGTAVGLTASEFNAIRTILEEFQELFVE